jgi:hypothetical protein
VRFERWPLSEFGSRKSAVLAVLNMEMTFT